MIFGKMMALILASVVALGPAMSFSPSAFTLPEDAEVLIVVEGSGRESECVLYAYEKSENGWKHSMTATGYIGLNGMSNNRSCGDKTTPIGVWKANTPFGQMPPMDGFPEDYITVDGSYTWDEKTNRLAKGPGVTGERVGTDRYKGYYDYVIDMGFNVNAVENKGDALFIHCQPEGDKDTSGCVGIATEKMIELMMLYGRHHVGTVYVACGPKGRIPMLYDAYGANNGLSPDGDFR